MTPRGKSALLIGRKAAIAAAAVAVGAPREILEDAPRRRDPADSVGPAAMARLELVQEGAHSAFVDGLHALADFDGSGTCEARDAAADPERTVLVCVTCLSMVPAATWECRVVVSGGVARAGAPGATRVCAVCGVSAQPAMFSGACCLACGAGAVPTADVPRVAGCTVADVAVLLDTAESVDFRDGARPP